ncbi:MAG: fibronectin-binding domain-containing protein [Candidatus Lokiarchaeota archaeon]|nr:fibronectin-binding domain-containing protein [Candidatus Lokiarchaeota archaeon]
MNNIDLNVVVRELRPDIAGKHVKNVYQLDENKFIITYRSDANKQLLIDIPNRMHLTQYNYDKPKSPPPFCVSLRKHVKDRKILDVYQVSHLDRIVVFELLGATGETLKLLVEFFGKGNIILLKPDGTVLVAKRYFRVQNEQVLPNKEFSLPEQSFLDIFEATPESILATCHGEESSVGKAIAGKYNVTPLYADELLVQAGIARDMPARDMDAGQARALIGAIARFKERLDSLDIKPQLAAKDDKFTQLDGFEPFSFVSHRALHVKDFPTFNAALDEYFSRDLVKDGPKKKKQEKKLSKNERILMAQVEQLESLKAQAKEYEAQGNNLYLYYAPLTKLLEVVLNARKQGMSWDDIIARIETGKQKGVEEALLFESADTSKPFIYVKVGTETIPLDIRYSLTENINKFFYDKSKKAKRKMPGARETIERFTKLVEAEKQAEAEQEAAKQAQRFKRRRKEWFEKFRWFVSTDGYLVLGGRDAGSNEMLFAKYTRPNDLFFHSDAPGAPVVIVKNKRDASNKDIPVQTLKEAATFGVSYSRSWREGLNVADIYSVSPDQVSKTPPSGEFLPKGSFVIRGERVHYRNVKLEISLGVKIVKGSLDVPRDGVDPGIAIEAAPAARDEASEESGEDVSYPVVIAGPPGSLKDRADFIVTLRPSKDGESPGALSSDLKRFFTAKIDAMAGEHMAPIDIEEIQGCIPPGKSLRQ